MFRKYGLGQNEIQTFKQYVPALKSMLYGFGGLYLAIKFLELLEKWTIKRGSKKD